MKQYMNYELFSKHMGEFKTYGLIQKFFYNTTYHFLNILVYVIQLRRTHGAWGLSDRRKAARQGADTPFVRI